MGRHEEPLPPPAAEVRPGAAAGREHPSVQARSGGPVRELTERHRSVCEQTVAPLAIAAGLAGAGPGPGPTGTAAAFRARTRPVLLVAIGLHPALPAVLSFAALAVLAALDPGPAAGAGLPAAAVGRVSALLPPCAWAVLGRPGGYRPAAPPL